MLEKLESLDGLESSCNDFKTMAEEYQQKVEELSAENEVCEFVSYRLSGRRLKILSFLLDKKADEGFRRLLTPFHPLSLTPLNKKIFDFQGSLVFYRLRNLRTDNR